MIGLFCFALAVLASVFKSRLRLEAENAVLRHQLIVLRRRLHGRVRLTNHDRWFLIQLYRWFPSILQVLAIIQPETLVRWHRAGFRCYWRWKSRPLGGRPQIDTELRALIRQDQQGESALGSTAYSWRTAQARVVLGKEIIWGAPQRAGLLPEITKQIPFYPCAPIASHFREGTKK